MSNATLGGWESKIAGWLADFEDHWLTRAASIADSDDASTADDPVDFTANVLGEEMRSFIHDFKRVPYDRMSNVRFWEIARQYAEFPVYA
jgi:hypothetical protein